MNFASQSMSRIQKSPNFDKTAVIKMERDVFGRLLAIAVQKIENIENCLKYRLYPAPPSLCQYNGDMHKADKSKLAKIVKSKISQSQSLVDIDVDVIDGFHFLHL